MIFNLNCAGCGKSLTFDIPDSFGLTKEDFRDCKCDACRAADEVEERRNRLRRAAESSFTDRWEKSMLNRCYMGFDPHHPEANMELFNAVQNCYIDHSLFLSGDSGTGKTRILQFFARELMLADTLTVYYSTWVDLCDEVAAHAKSERGKLAFVKYLRSVDLLIIDDLGKEAPSPARSATLWQILDSRYVANQMRHAGRIPYYGWRLWITTQLTAPELLQKFSDADGSAIIRRIIDSCQIFGRKQNV